MIRIVRLTLMLTNQKPYHEDHPKQKKFHRNVRDVMVHDSIPFSIASSPWFNRLVNNLDSRIKVKSRFSYSRDIKKEGRIMKHRSRAHVRNNVVQGIGHAADLWKSKGGVDYLGFTSQFIDSTWRWQKIGTGCRPFELQHSGQNLKIGLQKESDSLQLNPSIVKVMVTDTESAIVAGRRMAGFSSISCGIHKLHLVGGDAEKAPGTEDVAEALQARVE